MNETVFFMKPENVRIFLETFGTVSGETVLVNICKNEKSANIIQLLKQDNRK